LSGKTADRPELAACLDYLRAGDTLVVPSLDRLSRSLQDLITLVAGLRRRGTGFRSLHEALDTTTPGGRLSEQLPADLGVMSAAAGAAEALKLLLEVCTVRSMDDPRAAAVTANLARASDQLATAAEGIDALFAAARDVATIISPPV